MARRSLTPAVLLSLVVAACGTSTSSPSTPPTPTTAAPTPTAASAPPSPTAPADAVKAFAAAVLQVETTGEFRNLGDVPAEFLGHGSGFLIDADGLALTNNHVVTGAQTLLVRVGPEGTEYPAEVLGASECSDLAVIQVQAEDPLPFLTWFDGEIAPGLEIYAAGYPLGDPEFTLTGGIVTRARGIIDEDWASVERSIEHDANTNPGSSGGPIVTHDGQVVAVHYAGSQETRQQFAIGRDEALAILPDLEAGRDVTSIGVNGQADTDTGPPGIWVSSVQPSSTAAAAGILPGDRITKLDGRGLAEDGTMKEYCDVLRDHGAGDVLAFELYRGDSDETLTGELNGEPVTPGFSFVTELAEGTPDASSVFYDKVSEGAAALTFEAPFEWLAQDRAWTIEGGTAPGVLASTDPTTFVSGWTTPGAYVAASADLPDDLVGSTLLDRYRDRFEDDCPVVERSGFERGAYRGLYDLWTGCGGADSKFLTIAAEPTEGGATVYIQFQAVADEDLMALDRILTTLKVDLPS